MLSQPRDTSLTSAWQPVGPLQISSLAYGNVTGRITSIAIDPADTTGNTVYIGTTGGGVWKSVNAAEDPASVLFVPLTDTLPVFSPSAGTNTIASLSIGALSISNGVILAGTGDPNDALDSYYGSGILRSSDGGATWTLAQQSQDGVYGTHSFVGLGIAGLAWSSASPSVAVAAVSDAAEGELVNAPSISQSVRGLYYSNDAGITWQMAVIQDGNQIVQTPLNLGLNFGGNAATSVAWNPIRQRFYAAVRYHGYYESIDGSVWTRLAAQPGLGLTTSACPTNPGLTGSTSCPIFRGTLAVQPVSGDTFAFSVDNQLIDQGIWRDVCSAVNSLCASPTISFASRLNTAPLEQPDTTIPQGDYDLSLAAVASGADTLVFAGTVDLYRCSLSAGCAFRNTTNTENGCSAPALVSPSQHAISALSGAAPLLYLGNDGGLWRSTDGVDQQQSPCSSDDATHFQNLNGGLGSLAEVVNFSQHPTDADTLLVGVGTNGTAATSNASLDLPWQQLAAGEGGFNAIDPATPEDWYISTGPGVSISYCGKGADCAASDFSGQPNVGPTQLSEDDALIDAPWLLDPAFPTDVIIGTCRVWRGPASDGSSWSIANALSPEFGGPQNPFCDLDNSYVRALAAGGPAATEPAAPNVGSEVVYAGLASVLDGGGRLGGHILSTITGNTANASTAWSDLALSPVSNDVVDNYVFNPVGFDISSVVVDPHDPTGATIYATVMGFSGNRLNAPHVYRSVNAGANWINVTANLPNAPANSLAVDPNDANTVYVALDTGVYATTQISSCTTQNCWNVLGVGLPNAPVVQLSAATGLPAGGGSNGMLRAATYGRGIWQIPLLTAAPPVSAQIVLTPTSLAFTPQVIGSASPPQTITITNSGTTPLVTTAISTTGDFEETDNCVGTPVASGSSCSAQVVFHATSTGPTSGVLTFYANVSGGQATANLSGIGAAPASVVLDPLSLDFGLVTVGQTTAAQNITVSNTGGVTVTLQPPAISGDFRISANTCGVTLPPSVGCSIAVVFSPSSTGTRNGSLTIADSAGTQLVSLTGRGASVATDTLSPASLSFATQFTGTVSSSQAVTLTNSGDAALTLIAAQITNGGFTVVNGCGSSLSGHATCSMQVAFAPTSQGQQTGTLTVSDQFRTQAVSLSGIGVAPPTVALSPATLSFPGTVVGQSSTPQSVQISNAGSGQLTVTSVSISGDFTESDACTGKQLTGSATCAIQVIFAPTTAASRTGTLTVFASTPDSSIMLQSKTTLTGTGVSSAAIVLDPVSMAFGTVTIGSSSTPAQNMTISNTGGVTTTLQSATISGDFTISANTCGTTLSSSTGCTVAIVFTPTVSGTRTGTFSIIDSVGTQSAFLTGIGASTATDTLSPQALTFAPQQVSTSSAAQLVTLTNRGDNALTLVAVQVSGGTFTAISACGVVLSGHSSCTIAVVFAPVAVGATSGVLTVSDQFRSQTVALTGTGLPPPGVSLTPATGLTFAATGVAQTSAAQTVTLSNQGESPLTLIGINLTGEFGLPASFNTCGTTVAAGASCTFQVVFTPTNAGASTGTLSVSDNAPTSPQTLNLQGSGIDFSLNANGAASVTVSSGQSAVYPLLLTSLVGTSGTAALSCTGVPANSVCTVVPSSIPLGGTNTLTATVETGIAASAALPTTPHSRTAWWATLLPLSLFGLCLPGQRQRRSLLRLLVVACLLGGAGCGSGRIIPGGTAGGSSGGGSAPLTPSGTYTVTVTGTSAGLSRSVALTLVVQ